MVDIFFKIVIIIANSLNFFPGDNNSCQIPMSATYASRSANYFEIAKPTAGCTLVIFFFCYCR